MCFPLFVVWTIVWKDLNIIMVQCIRSPFCTGYRIFSIYLNYGISIQFYFIQFYFYQNNLTFSSPYILLHFRNNRATNDILADNLLYPHLRRFWWNIYSVMISSLCRIPTNWRWSWTFDSSKMNFCKTALKHLNIWHMERIFLKTLTLKYKFSITT